MTLSFLQTTAQTVQFDLEQAAANNADFVGASNDFGGWFGIILAGIMTIAALLLLLYLLWGGLDWLTAGGDSGKIEKARSKITQSIIGMIVLASTIAIFNLVQSFLGIEVLQFTGGAGGNQTPNSAVNNRTGTPGTSGPLDTSNSARQPRGSQPSSAVQEAVINANTGAGNE